ncbi:DUF58 domain-containing protein [Rossellomorea vietnamensis]|uniref:DUF58 domain-containing protein n=1 Tax=Rossellomorea vietnamensis TaxID=218284 RepID=A0A6I6UPH1_9BACI|nr:DUF58 domain-containing protein [Rossellomorea vietnamensis]QHE60410.1 DUF58 domain-containing protein [Rossellomorea vietnamensis]
MRAEVDQSFVSSPHFLLFVIILFVITSFFEFSILSFLLALFLVLMAIGRVYLHYVHTKVRWEFKRYTLASSVGDEEEFYIELANDSLFPIYRMQLMMESENDRSFVFLQSDGSESAIHKEVVDLPPRSQKTIPVKMKAKGRGLHTWSNFEIIVPDPFTLLSYRLEYSSEGFPVFEIYPPFQPLNKLHFRSIVSGHQSSHYSFYKDELSIIGTKDYENESFRHIHWLATAKENKIVAKKYEKVQGNVYSVLLNFVGNGNFFIRKDMESLIEYSVALCSLLIREGCHIEFYVNYASHKNGILKVENLSNMQQIKKVCKATAFIHTNGTFLSTNHFFDHVKRDKNPQSSVLIVGTAPDDKKTNWIQVKG